MRLPPTIPVTSTEDRQESLHNNLCKIYLTSLMSATAHVVVPLDQPRIIAIFLIEFIKLI